MHEELLDHSDMDKYILTDGKMFIVVPKIRQGLLEKREVEESRYKGFKILIDPKCLSLSELSHKKAVIDII